MQVDNLKGLHSMVYAWEAEGPLGWRGQLRFAPGAPLLDPYATVARTIRLPQSEAGGREILAGEALSKLCARPPVQRHMLRAVLRTLWQRCFCV
jgi:hypothetical protein